MWLIAAILCTATAVYDDEAGVYDWHMANIGFPNNVKFGYRQRMFVSTEIGIIAGLDAHDGSLLWRRNGEAVLDLQICKGIVVSQTTEGAFGWKARNGEFIWEVREPVTQILSFARGSMAEEVLILQPKNIRVLGQSGNVLVSLDSSAISSSAEFIRAVARKDLIAALVKDGAKYSIVHVGSRTGKVEKKIVLPKSPVALTDIRILGDAVLVMDSQGSQLHSVDLTSQSPSWASLNLGGKNFAFTSLATVASLTNEKQTLVVKIEDGELHILRTFEGKRAVGAVVADGDMMADRVVVMSLEKEALVAELLMLAGTSRAVLQQPFSPLRGELQMGVMHTSGAEVRVAVVSGDHSLITLSEQEVLWIREEALASVKQAFMWQPRETDDGTELQSPRFWSLFLEPDLLMIAAMEFSERLLSKATHFWDTISHYLSNKKGQKRSQEFSTLDAFKIFGDEKIVVVATCAGKVMALNTVTSDLVWQRAFPSSGKCALNSRTSDRAANAVGAMDPDAPVWFSAEPRSSKLVVLAREAGRVYWLELRDGSTKLELPYDLTGVRQVIPVKRRRGDAVRPVMLVGDKVEIIPKGELEAPVYTYDIDRKTNTVQGNLIVNSAGKSLRQPIWNLNLAERILTASATLHREHPHIPVHVKGDATVLFKYINPNMVSVLTQVEESGRSALTLHILDAVTGQILNRSRIRGTTPAQVVSCDNWVAVHYWNAELARFEFNVVELFEPSADLGPWEVLFGDLPKNVTRSAHSIEAPVSLEQSFIFPKGVTAMGVTSTAQGITPRSLVLALSSNQIFSISKDVLNPRRPIPANLEGEVPKHFAPTSEEAVQPYSAVLAIAPTDIVSHRERVQNIVGIVTSPTRLESTSFVFAYGVDCFFTIVQSANAYDNLSLGFNYPVFYVSILCLVLAVTISGSLSSGKALSSRWK